MYKAKNNNELNDEIKTITNENIDYSELKFFYEKIITSTTNENHNNYYYNVLMNKIDEIIKKSEYHEKIGHKKKVGKKIINEIFKIILKSLKKENYTIVEIFVSLCDYLNIKYIKGLKAIGNEYRMIILKNIGIKHDIFKKKNETQ